jgi:hypothetical protein
VSGVDFGDLETRVERAFGARFEGIDHLLDVLLAHRFERRRFALGVGPRDVARRADLPAAVVGLNRLRALPGAGRRGLPAGVS